MAGPTKAPDVPVPAKPALVKVPASPDDSFGTESDVTPDDLLDLPKPLANVAPSRPRPTAPPLVSTTTVTTGPEVTILIDDKSGGEPRRIVIPQASAWMLEMLTGEPTETEPTVTSALRPVRKNPVKSR